MRKKFCRYNAIALDTAAESKVALAVKVNDSSETLATGVEGPRLGFELGMRSLGLALGLPLGKARPVGNAEGFALGMRPLGLALGLPLGKG